MAENMDVIPTESTSGSPRALASATKNQYSRDQPVQVSVPMVPVSHNEKPEKITEDPPTIGEDEVDVQTQHAIEAWKHTEFPYQNYIMNGLSDPLYSVYSVKKTAKELWDILDHKYKAKDVGAKKFLIGQFLNFKMVDSKNVISQVQDLQLIIHGLHAKWIVLSESFQVVAIIEKLPPAWLDFKNYLKHKRKEMSVEDLIRRIRIEEDNKSAEKQSSNPNVANANMVEHEKGSKVGSKLGPKGGVSKKPKFQGKCFN
ncbi:uncharacterized protein LOC133817064 [Humulus lupulus]|uniref:uncharacterized protein LOC133817064 n=1 Tax=Humulus lupulus TaxID=3486 RepID=UPI002B407875|nr:uncharacterized protein LOC133817064 [Humulus lupulus]